MNNLIQSLFYPKTRLWEIYYMKILKIEMLFQIIKDYIIIFDKVI